MTFAPPVALVLGVVGLVRDRTSRCAAAGVVISGPTCGLLLLRFM